MRNLHKTIKIFILALFIFTFVINIIYVFYPELYISYATGTNIESISNLVNAHSDITSGKIGNEELNKLCAGLNSAMLVAAYNKLGDISFFLINLSLVISYIFIITAQETVEKKYKYTLLSILLLSYILYLSAYSSNWEWFVFVCK